MINKRLLPLIAPLALAGCISMAPDNQRPPLPVSQQLLATDSQQAPVQQLELQPWQAFFHDPNVKRLIAQALEHNRELRIATARVAEVKGRYQIEWEAYLPSVQGQLSQTRARDLFNPTGSSIIFNRYDASVGLVSYELDLFGKIRSLSDAALNQFYASNEAKRFVQISVVAETANAYYAWLSAKQNLALAEQTLASRQESLQLVQRRKENGVASDLDLAQARAGYAQVAARKSQLERLLAAARANLELLVGSPLQPLPTSESAGELPHMALQLPDNLSSEVLLLRPDVLAAEYELYAANGNIGAARVAFFPSLRLTGAFGFASSEFDQLFNSSSESWSFSPALSVPIFGNALNARLDVAEAQKQRLLATYEQTVQRAFAEVYQLMVYQKSFDDELEANRELVAAQRRRLELAEAKYKAGLASYFEVLSAQQDLFSAQQAQLETERARLSNTISLYKALGGGHIATVP